MRALLLVLFLTGCAHQTVDLKAHEEEHCEEFGIPKAKWVYHVVDDLSVCYKATGKVYLHGCALTDGIECHIILKRGVR